jgi:hypothetical protein
MTSCCCFYRKLCHYCGPLNHPWDPDLNWSTPQGDREHIRDAHGHPPPWPPPYEASKGVQLKLETYPCEVRVNLRFYEQSVVKQTFRLYTDSVFDDPHMDGKII